MPRTRSWNSGRRQQLLTKAVSPNFVAMSQASPNELQARPFPLLDAINAATGELVANGGVPGAFMALPRDPRDDNAFGPMDPLRPEAIDMLDSDGRTEPRLWQYPVGWNLPGNGNRETPWQVLRAAAAGVGIIRRCIEARKKDVSDLAFVFAPSEDAINDAYQKNPAAGRLDAEQKLREELMPEMARLREFWRRPWRTRGWDFKQWCRAALEDVLVVDGVPIYPRRTYGGDVYDLELIVPDTIKPLLDVRGNRPLPPFPAYQQLLYGFPRGEWAATAEYDEEGNATIPGGFMSSEMMYYVANTRTFSPFGFSPVEQALFDSRLYLQRQKWMLAEYDDGSTPLTWVETAAPADGQQMTLTQQKLWEKAFNARLAGQTRERHRVKVLPNGWKAMQMASVDERYRPEYDLYLIKLLASHFGVTATRLGFGETNGLGGSGFSESQMAVTGELGLKPDTEVLTSIINEASCHFLGMDKRIAGMFVDPSKSNSPEQAAVQKEKIQSGQISINEGRQADGQSLLPFEEANMPFVLGGPQGIIFLEGAKATIEQAMQAQQMAAETQALGTAGKLGLEEKKLEDGKEARKEEHDFQRQEREAAAEQEVKKAAELVAFRRWRAKPTNAGDEPRRPFLFKSVEPGDGWMELDVLGPAVVDYEGYEWVWDGDIEKAAKKAGKSPFDYLAWNASAEGLKHPKGPNGRWVKRGSDLHQALIAEGARHAKATSQPSDASTSIKPMETATAAQAIRAAKLLSNRQQSGIKGLAQGVHMGTGPTSRSLERKGLIEREGEHAWKLTDLGEAVHGFLVPDRANEAPAPSSVLSPAMERALKDRAQNGALEGAPSALAALERLGMAQRGDSGIYRATPHGIKQVSAPDQAARAAMLLNDEQVKSIRAMSAGFQPGARASRALEGKGLIERQGDDWRLTSLGQAVSVEVGGKTPDAEASARARQERIDAVKPKAEFLADVEEGINTGADSATLRRMVEQSVRRNNLADDPVAGHVQLNMDNASLNTAAAAWGLRRIGDEGTFDPALHSPIGDRPSAGGDVELVRPGYVFRDGGEEIQLSRAVVDGRVDAKPEPATSLAIDPHQEYRNWLANPRDITADSIDQGEGFPPDNKINMVLPDRDATLSWDGKSFIVRDMQTDELLPFKGQRRTTVMRQISRFYGKRVEWVNSSGRTTYSGSDVADLSQTPAGRKYKVSSTLTPIDKPERSRIDEAIQAGDDDALSWIASKGGKVRTDQMNIRRLERLRDAGLITMRDAKQGSLRGEPHERRYSEFRRVIELTDAGRAHVAVADSKPGVIPGQPASRMAPEPEAPKLDKPGIDSAGFVTSPMNAHSLGRGDMVVIHGVASNVVLTERQGSVVVVTLQDGRILRLGLNEPVRRVHGGNLRKAADVGEGGADPKAQESATTPPPPMDSRWPGWLMDTLIASAVATALLQAMPGLPIGDLLKLVRRLASVRPKGLATWQEMTPQERRGVTNQVVWELRQDGWPNKVAQRIARAIQNAHIEGAYVGQQVGRAVAEVTAAGGDITNPALELSIDWNNWEPGHPEAAQLLLEPGGLERLLRESGTVTKLLADARVDQIGRVIGEGLANGDPPKKIGARLAELFGDRTWADMTALTETNRAMSRASVDQYRDAGMLYKGWMTAFDQRVCDICDNNAHWPDRRPRIVPIDENFPSGDPHPPGHPRCRCAPIPILSIDLGKALTWQQWNVQHPRKTKDARGRWSQGLPGFEVLDEDTYLGMFGRWEEESSIETGMMVRLTSDEKIHLAMDLQDDQYQALSGPMGEDSMRRLRDALKIDPPGVPWAGVGRHLEAGDITRVSAELEGDVSVWPMPEGHALLTRTSDSAVIARLNRRERYELYDLIDHMIEYDLSDLRARKFDQEHGYTDDDDWQ